MAKAYKITSDPFYVNGNLTQDAIDTYKQLEISMPLDSLNREGVLVHAIYFTSTEPERVLNASSNVITQVTSTSKTGIVGVNDANLLARQEKWMFGGAAEFSGITVLDAVSSNEPYQEADNLGIIATDNVFLSIDSFSQTAVKSVQFRMVCSRIQLTASAYAALVTNELSS